MKTLLRAVVLLYSLNCCGQGASVDEGKKLHVYGLCKIKGGKIEGQSITIEKDGVEIKILKERKKFDFYLNYDAVYVVSIEKSGFITKQFEFNTKNVPIDRWNKGFVDYRYNCTLNEQSKVKPIKYTQPVLSIYFSEEVDEFDTKVNYDNVVVKQ